MTAWSRTGLPGHIMAIAIVVGGLMILGPGPASAHKPSDSYLTIHAVEPAIALRWDIALRDLNVVLGLDADGNGELTWGEVRRNRAAIEAYALARLSVRADAVPCLLRPTDLAIDMHTDGAYAVLGIATECGAPARTLDIDYRLLFDIDTLHRGLLRVEHGDGTLLAVFSPEASRQRFDLSATSLVDQALAYGREGVWHIWIGYDHVLFVITLLLPVALAWIGGHWQPTDRFGTTLVAAARIVTAFTIAHSLTLSLAVFDVVRLPSRLVESAVAVSVALVAVNNVIPIVTRRVWLVAFGFGLVHGLGFANVLADLGASDGTLVVALVAFNLGVEVGQLAIVVALLPLVFATRHSAVYRRVALPTGSLAIAGIAAVWVADRAFGAGLLAP